MWNMAETQLRYITDDHARHRAAAQGERLAREASRRWRPDQRPPSQETSPETSIVQRFFPARTATKTVTGGTPVSHSTPGV